MAQAATGITAKRRTFIPDGRSAAVALNTCPLTCVFVSEMPDEGTRTRKREADDTTVDDYEFSTLLP
ncbi:hypothetical protein GCM10023405_14830 [Streptomonospora salina]